MDDQSPRQLVSLKTHSDELRGVEKGQTSRKHVFPEGNYRADLPVRTDTLGLQDSPSRSDADIAVDSSEVVPTKAKPMLRKRRRSADRDSEFFESVPSTPGHDRSTKMVREPPQLIDGPFGNAFTGGRGRAQQNVNESESSEDEGSQEDNAGGAAHDDRDRWPPRRTSNKQVDAKGKGRAQDDGSIALRRAIPSKTPMTAGPSAHHFGLTPQEAHHPFTQPTQEYNNIMTRYFTRDDSDAGAATSDNVHHPFTQPSQAVDSRSSLQPRKHLRTFVEGLPDPDIHTTGTTLTKAADSKARRIYVPRGRVPAPTGTSNFQETDSSLSADPFLVPTAPRQKFNSEGKGKEKVVITTADKDRRKTFGGFTHPATPKIDLTLRTKLPHRRIFLPTRQSLPAFGKGTEESIPPRRASTSVGNHSTPNSTSSSPSNMSNADHSIALRLGVDAMVQRMSDNHGFTPEVVRRLYGIIGDFQRTDVALMRMRKSAEIEAASYINVDVNEIDEHTHSSRYSSSRPSPRRVSYRFPGLEYTPATADSGNISDYSPPETSRAGQYARLARQGLRLEALKREGRAASLSGNSDLFRSLARSGGSSPLVAPKVSVASVDGQSTASAPALVPVPLPQQPVWGEEEDRLLRSGDPVALKKLEAKMGKAAFKRRTAEINM
jgi:hypothetical protein